MAVFEFLHTRSSRFIWILGIMLVIIIGSLDFITGSEVSFSIFYLIPIVIVTWFIGHRAGMRKARGFPRPQRAASQARSASS